MSENITDRQPDAIYPMVAKTFQGLEEVLAEELRALGALNVEPGRRMVSFEGDKRMMYLANLSCRTALRILVPFATFTAEDTDQLYDRVKELDWGRFLTPKKTFSIDPVVYSDRFTNSRYVTYKVKDAVVDWFQDRLGAGVRPGIRLDDADAMINVHIAGTQVTLSLDSSGESLHKRGYRVASTEAPINEVLAAGIILKSGWRGDCPLVDPMCGSGTFLIEAALIGANIMPGVYRRHFAFEQWEDFDQELFESLYNDDSAEREFSGHIYGADMSEKAIEIATRNVKSAGVAKYITLEKKALSAWEQKPGNGEPGVLVTNPPYGERLKVENLEALYGLIGSKLKNVFTGYHAWIIGAREQGFEAIGLAPSYKETLYNGPIECWLREYVIFEGDYRSFRAMGGSLRNYDEDEDDDAQPRRERKGKFADRKGKFADRKGKFSDRRSDDRERRPSDDRRGGFKKHDFKERRPQQSFEENNEENPLAARRNPHALKSLTNKQPSLLKKGWKRKSE